MSLIYEIPIAACARNSVLTLAICSYIIVGLCYGIFSMNVSEWWVAWLIDYL